jgi:hypothetical protein
MRKALFSLALLASAFTLPLTAHADAIDDFVLTGNGTTATFSLPASPPGNPLTCPPGNNACLPGSETSFSVSTLVTTDGITTEKGIGFPTGRFFGGLLIGPLLERFQGPQLFEPDAANPTFLIGTFILDPLFSTSPGPIHYTLTITPETSASTPEPSSLFLFATGALGLLLLSNRRRRLPGRASLQL